MRRAFTALFLAIAAGSSQAEIIDRIAVSVANRVITQSEIERQIRITAFLNGEKPEFTAANRRQTAERLVEQTLIRREIATTRYITSETVSEPLYQEFRKQYKDDAAYNQALAGYGITDADVKEAFNWQSTLLDFVEARFRPGVQLSDADLKDYFDTELAPKLAAAGEKPSFDEAKDKVEAILTQQRVDNALDRWLGQARTQTRIRFHREVMR
jgi:peptidyl-prolyl cis-trans isomerase SurA